MGASIVTKTGDGGTTGLASGNRVNKNDPVIRALGALDELNANVGLLISGDTPVNIGAELTVIQNDLFVIGSELAGATSLQVNSRRIEELETSLDEMDSELEPIERFILPGGCHLASQCHVTRAICRRAERELVAANELVTLSESVVPYVNRLSDWLFITARWLNKDASTEEVFWEHE